jgi:signal transduction histidine kinase
MGVGTWLPLAFIVMALLALLLVPILVNRRTREIARQVDEGNRVRVLLNDLEAAGATQALIAARVDRAASTSATDSLGRDAARAAEADDRELDSLLREAPSESRRDLGTIDTIEQSWRAARGRGTNILRDTAGRASPLQLLAAAERLDDRLGRRTDSLRARARDLQSVTVVSAVVLTPVALLSVLAVFWAGTRSNRLARRLASEGEALAQSIEARAALVRGITHDLKNPLGAAMGYVDLLLDGVGHDGLDPTQATMLTRVKALLAESIATISSLLDLARVHGTEALSIEQSPVDVDALLRDVLEDYRAAARERDLSVGLEKRGDIGTVVTDPRHLRHILGNLMSNAVKYTPPGGRIRIDAYRNASPPRHVCIAVCDTGPGVPPEQREAIFEEFTRLDAQTEDASGHGVGLAISRRLARMLGGTLTVGDAPEGGAMFTLKLPAQRHTAGSSMPSTHTE